MNARHICPCWHCQNPIRFSEERAGENINCPHCEQETQLFIQGAKPRNKKRDMAWLIISGVFVTGMSGLWLSGNDQVANGIISLIFFGALIALYFLPSIIAGKRGHRNGAAIGIVNLFLGWTLIGWVVALAWAVYEERPATKA